MWEAVQGSIVGACKPQCAIRWGTRRVCAEYGRSADCQRVRDMWGVRAGDSAVRGVPAGYALDTRLRAGLRVVAVRFVQGTRGVRVVYTGGMQRVRVCAWFACSRGLARGACAE